MFDRGLSTSFWLGVVACTGLRMAHQDWLGLDAYLEACRSGWVDLSWWVGGLVCVIAVTSEVVGRALVRGSRVHRETPRERAARVVAEHAERVRRGDDR